MTPKNFLVDPGGLWYNKLPLVASNLRTWLSVPKNPFFYYIRQYRKGTMSSETLLNNYNPPAPILPGSGLETTLSHHHNGVMTYSQYVNGSIFSVPKFEVAGHHKLIDGAIHHHSLVTASHLVGHRHHTHQPMVYGGTNGTKASDHLVDTVYGLVKSFLGWVLLNLCDFIDIKIEFKKSPELENNLTFRRRIFFLFIMIIFLRIDLKLQDLYYLPFFVMLEMRVYWFLGLTYGRFNFEAKLMSNLVTLQHEIITYFKLLERRWIIRDSYMIHLSHTQHKSILRPF